jgi:hypothetical protein
MSAIQVRDIKGNWSEELQGIDKRYFIKKAFITEYRELYERTEGDFYGDAEAGVRVDGVDILLSEITDKEREWAIDFSTIEDILTNARLVEVGEGTLHQMAKDDECLSALYKKIINLANIPPSEEIDYFDGYWIMLKFSDETYTYRLESPEAGNLYFDGTKLNKVEVE